MSSYTQARIAEMMSLLNNDVSKLHHLMIMTEKIRDAENIDFQLQDPLLELEAAVNKAQKLVQQLVIDAGLQPTTISDLATPE